MSLRLLSAVFAIALFSNAVQALAQGFDLPGDVQVVAVPKGSGTIVRNGYVEDTTKTDLIFILLTGIGRANLDLYDADATGDTISATGNFFSVQPLSFTASATSPAHIVETATVPGIGLWVIKVNYTGAVNPTPLQYIYKLTF